MLKPRCSANLPVRKRGMRCGERRSACTRIVACVASSDSVKCRNTNGSAPPALATNRPKQKRSWAGCIMARSQSNSFPGVVGAFHPSLALVADGQFAADQVAGDDSAPDLFAQFDLRFAGLELASAHDDAATADLERGPAFIVAIP